MKNLITGNIFFAYKQWKKSCTCYIKKHWFIKLGVKKFKDLIRLKNNIMLLKTSKLTP